MKQKTNDKINGKKGKNPLSFSCEEMLKYLPDFRAEKLRSKVVLVKIRKHLKDSVSGNSSKECGCPDLFVELQKEKEKKQ